MNMETLTLKNVSYRYTGSKKDVLHQVNMEFKKGVLYGIVGKSGAGKSTLLSLISGLDQCVEGEILYNGKSLKDIDRDDYRAKDIGVIFQGYNLLNNATVIDNILLAMDISKVKVPDKKAFAYALLDRVGISQDMAKRKVLKLSGGEQQRVGIARAMSHHPDVLIADEPTGNLDSETEKSMMELFRYFAHEEGKCVIIVTHSKTVSQYTDELYGLSNGRLSFIK